MHIISTLFVSSLSLSFLLLLSLPTPSLSTKCNKQDKKVLKQIEKALTIPPHFQSWTTDTDCCEWAGVECDPDTNRVTYLNIQDFIVVSGRIPDAIGDLPALRSLIFQNCRNLQGPIPQSLTKLTNLTSLYLFITGVSGPVPSFLSQLKNLESIDLPYNSFSGPIPSSLSKLPKLSALHLQGNKLTGSVPKSLGSLDFIVLDFSSNNLEGDISFLFGKNRRLDFADFSNNLFKFDMSKVEFPEKLYYLDLSHNMIYGSIPVQMTRLKLDTLHLSYNRLCGKIPTGGKLQQYDQSVYLHNRCLCGPPLAACK